MGLAAVWARRRWLIVTVDGASMIPALLPGDRLLARRVPPATIRTGDVVVAARPLRDWERSPHATEQRWIIKRAVAIPGDPVPRFLGEASCDVVPHDMYVLLGDNAADSLDSRTFGYVSSARIMGVVPRSRERAQLLMST
jgi:signal peptidase I